MPEVLSELLIRQVGSSAELSSDRGRSLHWCGQNDSLQKIAARTGYRYINVNLELSQRLLELTRQRVLQVHRLLGEIIGNTNNQVVLLDNLEILFEVSLCWTPPVSPGISLKQNTLPGTAALKTTT